MRLSGCLLARDEEANLPRCLASLAPVVDEVVVCDTGSRDRTVAIAEAAGARVVHFPWCDDFAAAHNFLHRHATGDWILWIDADEELLPIPRKRLQRLLRAPRALAYLVTRLDLVAADDPESYTEMVLPRLFRRRPELTLVGRCHPEFRHPSLGEVAAREGLAIAPSPVRLRHYGYTAEQRPGKLRRAARLLALELEERPGQLYYQIELGRTLLELGDPSGHRILAEATAEVWRHRHDRRPPTPHVALLFDYLLGPPAPAAGGLPPRAAVAELAARWFPDAAPLLWRRAQIAFEGGDFATAAGLLERLLRLGRDHGYDHAVSFDPAILGDQTRLNLGVCYTRLARLEEAAACFRGLRHSPTCGAAARANLAVVERLRR
ncbi:MAG: glycosyltransferase family 2 protein, partial [Nitrospirae bacterium]